jgi:putative intracellular protease/amidase
MATKRILIVLSEWGFWGEELIGPLETFDQANYSYHFVTPTGRRPVALPVSKDPSFVDPPLGKPVVAGPDNKGTDDLSRKQGNMAAKVTKIDDPNNPLLSTPISLKDWFPANPYPSSPKYLREREAYFNALDDRKKEIAEKYDAILLVGGSGPLADMANNYRVKDLIRCFYESGKPVAAECYGVTCLAFTYFSEDDGRPIIWGKHVTGHPRPYDYQEGSAWWDRDKLKPDGSKGDWIVTDFPTVPLQLVLELAVGPEGRFHGNVGKEVSVIVDYPFITGRSTADSYGTGEQLLRVLKDSTYRRYGW